MDDHVAKITAQQGAKLGKWTRPDIVVASIKSYTYVHGKQFDLVTFEVKPTHQINVTAV